MPSAITVTITSSADVKPEQLLEYIKCSLERSDEPCMLNETVHEFLEGSEIWIEDAERSCQTCAKYCGCTFKHAVGSIEECWTANLLEVPHAS
ncbi:MAG: hypothetical protein KKF77_01330 [Proteobacteria bacterium]|nr:hypothetical protein [Pseudomonadota bacterium]